MHNHAKFATAKLISIKVWYLCFGVIKKRMMLELLNVPSSAHNYVLYTGCPRKKSVLV